MSRRVIPFNRVLTCLLVLSVLFGAYGIFGEFEYSATAASTPSSRVYLRTNTRVYHHWLLTKTGDPSLECHIYTIDHDRPGHEDVLGFCDLEVYRLWASAELCYVSGTSNEKCSGMILHDLGEIDTRLKTTIWLPLPEVSFEFLNCQAWEICEQNPSVKVTGYEPLLNHRVESVHVEYADHSGLVCWRTAQCITELPRTNEIGTTVTVYVRSSYGDGSAPLSFRLRILSQPDGTNLFQVLQTSWDYLAPPESIAWGIFPDLEIDAAPWLLRTNFSADLATSHDYSLLAGRYILRGDVDISSCVYGGLTENGGATECGMDQARELVIQTQNEYDDLILEAALKTRIPPRIIKGVIAQESQFWPEWYILGEYGLGMLTDEGMEMMLTWNLVGFLELCIPEYGAIDCAWGYDSLGKFPQDNLRGLALSAVGTDQEVYRIAQTIVGAAAQSGQLVRNVTNRDPYEVLSYQDMWKITLGVYNSGVGCMYYAMGDAWDGTGRLTWGDINERLRGDCQNAADYPNSVLFNGVP